MSGGVISSSLPWSRRRGSPPYNGRVAKAVMLCLMPAMMAAVAAYGLEPSWVFGSDMVLQADRAVPVWGQAEPGTAVTVAFGGQVVSAITGADGEWAVQLGPMEATSEPRELRIESPPHIKVFTNIVVGDVWLCAGQSNMQKPWLGEVPDYADEVERAHHPLIREFRADLNIWSAEPRHRNFHVENRRSGDYAWFACDPESAKTWPSIPYFFATMLQRETGRPIGLLRTQVGATSAEAWISWDALAAEPMFAEYMANCRSWIDQAEQNRKDFSQTIAAWEERQKQAEDTGALFEEKRPSDHIPELWPRWWASAYYNSHIAPLRNFALRGVIWYQGENNAARKGGCAGDVAGYVRVMEILIDSWRQQFEQPDLPFYQVQLSAFGGRRFPNANEPSGWSMIREAQEIVAAKMPGVGMAVSMDIGVKDNIHPPEKKPVGERLARLALRDVYGKDVIADGPRFASHEVEGDNIRIRFDHAYGGLKVGGDMLSGFAIAGADGRYEWAEAALDGDEVLAWSEKVPEPVHVRYGYIPFIETTLYNGEGLPAMPFRSDTGALE